ncbi:hypothetical protein EGI16_03025 [Chryseobacterium sp. G0240]|uniref:L-type lectin-domain containing protein n=1 Tax=Chryseobacterium sp. G0240 TaxID=2487066 RepID=UPI000F44FAB2|nr:L-type lectin-domain containing protein [Chryseobacterium sp. G0240]ROI06891.1 hypothetical protein EGI16_03025 [Chryseobacterium sp. G0240]
MKKSTIVLAFLMVGTANSLFSQVNKTVDLDSDNDGISDCLEKRLEGSTMSDLFVLKGNAVSGSSGVPTNEVRLTADTNSQSGQMWSIYRINFKDSFVIRFQAYLGTKNSNGADGVACVFHNDPLGTNTTGSDGIGLGAAGIKNGLALELDTFQNSSNSKDISNDHGMIWDTDWNISSGSTVTNLTNAVDLGNIEDGLWHNIEISWDAGMRKLSYKIDNITAGSYTHSGTLNDFCQTYFNIPASSVNKLVYYGYTASTGGFSNEQKIRFNNLCADYPQFVDTDGDGIPDHLDLDSDNDGCPDAIEGDENVKLSQLNPDGSIDVTTTGTNANGFPNIVNAGGVADIGGDEGQGIGSSKDASVNACICYKQGALSGNVLNTTVGITSLGRAGGNAGSWPMVRKGGWIALEAKTKGFTPNRLTTAQKNALVPVEGMIVYDTTLDCLSVYNGTAWKCLNNQVCPDTL